MYVSKVCSDGESSGPGIKDNHFAKREQLHSDDFGFNLTPLEPPKSLSILTASKFVLKNSFPSCKRVKEPRHSERQTNGRKGLLVARVRSLNDIPGMLEQLQVRAKENILTDWAMRDSASVEDRVEPPLHL